jgi:predicted nucleic acid-binding protein
MQAVKIYKELRGANKLIDLADIFIVATCMAKGFEIVTLNTKHFSRIQGLTLLHHK